MLTKYIDIFMFSLKSFGLILFIEIKRTDAHVLLQTPHLQVSVKVLVFEVFIT